jgi:hypothetical protein
MLLYSTANLLSIWLLDVAREVSEAARLDGFDISLDQCPPSPWLPANMHVHTWNIFEEPSEEFREVFDVVHIRLITVAIKDNDPRPVLANLRKLLSKSNTPPLQSALIQSN